MAGPQRPPSALSTRRSALRQPTRRANSTAPERTNSPRTSKLSGIGALRAARAPSEQPGVAFKRKEREFESAIGSSDTSIHVVVRCRGRNDREVKENSGVVVSTEGVRGATVDLSMGPNALSNKTYNFDKVFSPAADQSIVFEEVVAPILNEMLAGFNCTIFAYGQTGTGKTYTMSGDMTDTLGILSDDAGIIPRVLYSLFHKLEETESTVKCSFIELYNEELKDLLSAEENAKLKIYENESKKSHSYSTLVQGMEETYIDSAHAGIKLLQKGSHRRQVAATKCNDLSSRSHTVFTITVYTKRTSESGEDYISSGKLNLVDLAGSENIQRSGAENKRATEAGLINKSLLTLGRVINALVDKASHIPYRESKLTRLLQDSLGGHTKTCIIATISPARSNLEETISTLDYAFRAKNIRNKPQINTAMSKNTLLREFTIEIEKWKSELIATRHRNGVYMTPDAYEEMTVESESRRIVNEEQRAKIESMEHSLRNKVNELLTLTGNFNNMKKENEEVRAALSSTNDILRETEIVLKSTRESLEEEEILRKAHQRTEEQLRSIGTNLLDTLGSTVHDVQGLHDKISRKSELHAVNQQTWKTSTTEVVGVTSQIDAKISQFQRQQSQLLDQVSNKVRAYVEHELDVLQANREQLQGAAKALDNMVSDSRAQTATAHDEMSNVLEEIKVLREEVKSKIGDGLSGLSAAAARISREVITELAQVHTQLHDSYSTIGNDFKSILSGVRNHLGDQTKQIIELREQLQEANRQVIEANGKAAEDLADALEEERASSEAERDLLLAQIKSLIDESRQRHHSRLQTKVDMVQTNLYSSKQRLSDATAGHRRGLGSCVDSNGRFRTGLDDTENSLEAKLADDWKLIDERNASIQKATGAVHEETVRIVDMQMKDLGNQMQALDAFVTKARTHDCRYKEAHLASLEELAGGVRNSYSTLDQNLHETNDRLEKMHSETHDDLSIALNLLQPLTRDVREPLSNLRTQIQDRPLKEYTATGQTPQRMQYHYPTALPQTESHESLIARLRNAKQLTALPFIGHDALTPNANGAEVSPAKSYVYADCENEPLHAAGVSPASSPSQPGLREIDGNVVANLLVHDAEPSSPSRKRSSSDISITGDQDGNDAPPTKRRRSTTAKAESKLPQKTIPRRATGMAELKDSAPRPARRLLRNRDN